LARLVFDLEDAIRPVAMDRELLAAGEGDLELVAPQVKDRLLDGGRRMAVLLDLDGLVNMRASGLLIS